MRTGLGRAAEDWAGATFAPAGALRPAGLGLAGKVHVLDEWRPRSGPALVARAQVPLSSADGFAAYEAQRQLGSAKSAVLASRRALVDGAARLESAESRAKAAAAAAQQAVGALGAGVSLSQAAVAAQGEATSAERAATKAEEASRAAEGRLGAAERQEARAERRLQRARQRATSVAGVYDVAFDRKGRAVAWAPAGYGA